MTKALFIAYLVSILHGTSTLSTLTNQQLDHMHHAYTQAIRYGVDPEKVILLGNCESKWVKTASGDYRSETGEYMARGIFQWWRSSWSKYSNDYGLSGDRLDPYDNIDLTIKVLADGGEKNWYNCWKSINE